MISITASMLNWIFPPSHLKQMIDVRDLLYLTHQRHALRGPSRSSQKLFRSRFTHCIHLRQMEWKSREIYLMWFFFPMQNAASLRNVNWNLFRARRLWMKLLKINANVLENKLIACGATTSDTQRVLGWYSNIKLMSIELFLYPISCSSLITSICWS